MVANLFFDSLNKFQWNTHVGVDDLADKCNFLITVIILLICISVVTIRQYVLKPISCYLSTDIGGINLLEYMENFCWVHGTIPISYNGSTPSTDREWQEIEKYKILYYQWVPFVLGIQCILFHLPQLIWKIICYNQTGTDIQHIITSANQAVHSNDEAKERMTIYLARTVEQMLFQNYFYETPSVRRRIYDNSYFCITSKHMGTCIVRGYFGIKILYIGNAIGQLFLMRYFLGFESFSSFGLKVLNNLLNGKDWQVTLIFPRVAFCYAKIRQLGARNNAAMAQCVLPVNMLNEKIYIFLWHWILLCAILSFISLLLWIYKIGIMRHNSSFIRKLLLLNEKIRRHDINHRVLVDKFTKSFLKHDGVFLLRMMSLNAGDMVTGEVVCHLWAIFNQKYKFRKSIKEKFSINCDGDGFPSAKSHFLPDVPPIQNGYVGSARPSAPLPINHSQDKDSYTV